MGLILLPSAIHAQQEGWITDAREVALAGAAQVELSARGNPAAMTSEGPVLSVYGSRFISLPGSDHRSVFIQNDSRAWKWGFGAVRFGDISYNRQALSGAIAHRIDRSTLGVRLDWNQFRSDARVSRALIFTVGGVTEIRPGLRVGAYLENPAFASLGNQSLPVKMSAGIALQPSEGCTLYALVKKDLTRPPSWHGAMEFRVRQNVMLRVGFRHWPMLLAAGAGFRYWKVDADYGFQYNRATGVSLHATARYRLSSGKK